MTSGPIPSPPITAMRGGPLLVLVPIAPEPIVAAPMTADLLTPRQLNRATLHRQHLLGRVRRPALDVVRQLVGLQAQNPRDPYVALWSRLVDFDPTELEELLLDRQVVRLVVQRGTVHVVTADDCLVLRPLAQPILVQQLHAHQTTSTASRASTSTT